MSETLLTSIHTCVKSTHMQKAFFSASFPFSMTKISQNLVLTATENYNPLMVIGKNSLNSQISLNNVATWKSHMYDRNQVFFKKSLHIFISEKTLLTGLRNQDTWPRLHHIQVQKGNQNASVLFPPLWGVQRVAKVVHIHFLQVRLILSGRSRPRTHLLLNMYQ